MDFQQAANEYRHLKQAYQTGEISAEAFEKQVNLMVVYHQGQKWMIGVSSGKWYRHDGTRWVEDTPETPPVPAVPQEAAQSVVSATSRPRKAEIAVPQSVQKTKDTTIPRWIWPAIMLALVVMAVLAAAGLMLTGLVEPPAQLAALFTTATPTATSTPLNSPTPTQPPATPTPSPIPIDADQAILGSWTDADANSSLSFYPDSSFVYYDPLNKNIESGTFSLLSDTQIQFETLLGEEIFQTRQTEIHFTDENSFSVMAANEATAHWQRSTEPLANTRFNDPLALLDELAYRLGWAAPDPDCGFDRSDEVSSYQFVCLDVDEFISLTWVDQSPSNGDEREMERSLITVNVYHNSQTAYQTAQDQISSEMTPAEPFHTHDAFQAQSDLGWFTTENFAWVDGPWLFSLFRVNSLDNPNSPAGLMLTAETLYEILQGQPPKSSFATIPTPIPEGGSIYANEIIGLWEQRYTSEENLEFYDDGTIRVYSVSQNYDYAGHYTFTDDEHLTFDLNIGKVEAAVKIEGNVMTLTINGIAALYYRVEQPQQ